MTSASALTSAVGSNSAAVIRVSGTISCSGMLRVRSNKTIIGNSGATIAGCGLNINGNSNVIIRNINFRNWNDDAINVQESAKNIWIDHNSFSAGKDGAVDIKRGSDFITVSWNRVFNHDKSFLLGHSDDNASQDRGHLRVTYHHNWFDRSTQRHPRVRFGNPVHVYNNYYNANSGYGVASTEGAGVLVEANSFEGVSDPYHLGGLLRAGHAGGAQQPAGQLGLRADRRQCRIAALLLHRGRGRQRQVDRYRERRRRPDLHLIPPQRAGRPTVEVGLPFARQRWVMPDGL